MTELEKMNESLKKAGESLSRVSMQARIACLENELAYERKKNGGVELPSEPIKVAEMLIDATETYETSSLAKKFGAGDTTTYKLYSNADLRQIAEHLLVYCNNAEE